VCQADGEIAPRPAVADARLERIQGWQAECRALLLTEAWEPLYKDLDIDPTDESPPFLKPAIDELATTDT
jgi:hypothetical protein